MIFPWLFFFKSKKILKEFEKGGCHFIKLDPDLFFFGPGYLGRLDLVPTLSLLYKIFVSIRRDYQELPGILGCRSGSRLTGSGSRLTGSGSRLTGSGSRLTGSGSGLTGSGSTIEGNKSATIPKNRVQHEAEEEPDQEPLISIDWY